MNTHISPLAYTVDQAATAIGVGRTTLYGYVRAGKLPVVKIGKRTLIREGDLSALLAGHLQAA